MKNILYIIIAVTFLMSCNKGKTGPRNLNAGHGTWLVETIELTYYDSIGNEISKTVLEEPGEITFLSTHWGTAPEFLGVYLHFDTITNGLESTYSINYYSDGDRLTIDGQGVSLPVLLEGQFTIAKDGRKNQVWNSFLYFSNPNFQNRISVQETITLKKKKSL